MENIDKAISDLESLKENLKELGDAYVVLISEFEIEGDVINEELEAKWVEITSNSGLEPDFEQALLLFDWFDALVKNRNNTEISDPLSLFTGIPKFIPSISGEEGDNSSENQNDFYNYMGTNIEYKNLVISIASPTVDWTLADWLVKAILMFNRIDMDSKEKKAIKIILNNYG